VAEISHIFFRDTHVLSKLVDVTGGKPIAVLLQSISGVSAINPLVAFYDIHGGKREVLFFYFVPNNTRDMECFGMVFTIKNLSIYLYMVPTRHILISLTTEHSKTCFIHNRLVLRFGS
jgi:hypothetical protein